MRETPQTDGGEAVAADGDSEAGADPGVAGAGPLSAQLARLAALIRGPRKKRIIIFGGGALFLLVLMVALVLGVSRLLQPAPPAAPAVPTQPALQAAPAVAGAPTPPSAERTRENTAPTAVEDRFEALKRGDFAARTPGRPPQETAPKAEHPPAPAPAQTSQPASQPAPTGSAEKAAPAAATAAPQDPPRPSAMTPSGCNVGTGDPKASAEAILDCIREFNAIDGRDRPRKAPARASPGK